MDLNQIQPEPRTLNAVKLRRQTEQEIADEEERADLMLLPDPTEFTAQPPEGESIGDEGFDVGHPISPEEAEALGEFNPNTQLLLDTDLHRTLAGIPFSDEQLAEQDQIIGTALVDKGFTNEPTTRHPCFVTPCSWYLDVPPVEPDMSSILSGVSVAMLEQAREVEELLTAHLQTHTLLEWATALKQAQNEAQEAARATRITSGYSAAPQGSAGAVGATRPRDPARQAAVDALDARLSGRKPGQPMSPEEVEAHDNRLREMRRARKAREVSPYELTPRWTPDLDSGVVGIKR